MPLPVLLLCGLSGVAGAAAVEGDESAIVAVARRADAAAAGTPIVLGGPVVLGGSPPADSSALPNSGALQAANALAGSAIAPSAAKAKAAPGTSATAMEDVLNILKREGLIDDGEEQKVLAKYAVENKDAGPAWLKGTDFTADFRLRYEGMFFDNDARGVDQLSRNRFRYRARLGFTRTLGERVKIGVRLATGTGDARSTNQSFGEGNNDGFSPDPIFFDRAYLEYKLQDSKRMQTQIVAGKLPNPFIGKVGQDLLLFDSDINLEGAFVTSSFRPNEVTRVYGTVGGFIADEVAAAKDPKLVAAQLGFESALSDRVSVGLRGSAYQYRSLDMNFLNSAMMFGNLASAFKGKARLGETFGYVNYDLSDAWPVLVYASAVKNFTADDAMLPIVGAADPNGVAMVVGMARVGEEDMAYSAGLEVGNASKFARFGVGLFHVEANALLAQFTDTDPLDGFTNREGVALFATRKLNPSTELKFSFFDAEEIRTSGGANGPFRMSLMNADRKLARLDLLFAF